MAKDQENRSTKVVVIGAGISGLSAAKLLTENGIDVTVVEARDRVGGRTFTLRDDRYQYTDVGGAYVGPAQRRVARMAKDMGLEFYKVNEELPSVMLIRGSWMKFRGMSPPIYNPIAILDVNNLIQTINKMSKQVPPASPWDAPKAKEWDQMTVKEFLDKTCWTWYGKEFGAVICREIFCVETHELSVLNLFWYTIQGQSIHRLTSVTDGAQERKFVGGAMQLSEKMAERIGAEKIHFNDTVIRIEEKEGAVKVITESGNIHQADYIISAIPATLLNRMKFDPVLPPLKIQLIQRLPMGSIIKTMTFYKTAFWREKGFSGQMVTDLKPVRYCIDDTKPDGSSPCIMGFIQANAAREIMGMSEQERKTAVCEHYARVFKCDLFKEPVHYVEKNWAEEEYSGGCYVATLPPGVMTSFFPVLREPHGRVYFAGTETATAWAGYMDGAIQAGERAAREVLNAVGLLPSSEIYQDEPASDYFGEPPAPEMSVEKHLPSVGQFLSLCASAVAMVAGIVVYQFCDLNYYH